MKKSILLLCSFFLFFSCSEDVPQIAAVYPTLVFDYHSENEKPIKRLSVFVSINSDKERYAGLQIQSLTNDIVWNIDNPQIVVSNSNFYLGSNNLRIPENKLFAAGEYRVFYENMAGKKDSIDFIITPKEKENLEIVDTHSFSSIKTKKVLNDFSIERRIIYNAKDEIIYYGQIIPTVSNPTQITQKYPEATYFRRYFMTKGNKMGILYPKETL